MSKYVEPMPPINFSHLIKACFKENGDNFSHIVFTQRGREAIKLSIKGLGLNSGDTLLLPALLCDTVTAGFGNSFNFKFYDLNEDLSINVKEVEEKLKNNTIKVLYVIHYFGFIQSNIHEISNICKYYSVFLIEDHAHSGLSKINYEYADAKIFSFRKLFPVPDGGGVWLRKSEQIPKIKNSFLSSNIIAIVIAFKRLASLYNKSFRKWVGVAIQKDINKINQGTSNFSVLSVSHFSGNYLKKTSLKKHIDERRNIFNKWLEILSGTDFKPYFLNLPNECAPQGLPINIRNPIEVLEALKEYNIFLKIHWPQLPVTSNVHFNNSLYFSRNSLTLPIYPGLKEKQMIFIKDYLKKHGIPINS